MTDKQLIRAISQNNDMAFATLIKKYQRLVYATSFRVVNNALDAEDIAQDVFLETFRSVHHLRSEDNLPAWLYRVAYNRSISFLRKRNPANPSLSKEITISTEFYPHGSIVDVSESPVLALELKESNRALFKAIDQLPENQKAVLLLHKMDGFSYKEIAEQMQLSIASVESLIYRAKQNLRKGLVHYFKNH